MSSAASPLQSSHLYCHEMAKRSRSSFYPAFALLPPTKRGAMEALYAFLRHVDDLADGPLPVEQRRRALGQLRSLLCDAVDGSDLTRHLGVENEPLVQILPALVDAMTAFNISPVLLATVVDGVDMDVEGRTYESFDDLAQYCHCVASAVGLACIKIWGCRGREVYGLVGDCGLAFQLTNILRDVKEDAEAGRVYLPQRELREFHYEPDELRAGVADKRFRGLMTLQTERARSLYRSGAALFDYLERDGRRIFGMMFSTYYALLRKIERAPQAVLQTRVRLPRWRKAVIALRWAVRPPRRLTTP